MLVDRGLVHVVDGLADTLQHLIHQRNHGSYHRSTNVSQRKGFGANEGCVQHVGTWACDGNIGCIQGFVYLGTRHVRHIRAQHSGTEHGGFRGV